jgi:hypothetical protein
MDVRHIEQYNVEAWVEDLAGLYYGYGHADDLEHDPASALVRNFCVNRMVEHILEVDAEMRRRRNIFLGVVAAAAIALVCWLVLVACLLFGRVM